MSGAEKGEETHTGIDRNSKEQPHTSHSHPFVVREQHLDGREEKGAARGQPGYALSLGSGVGLVVMHEDDKNLMIGWVSYSW